jgi:putative inorganic carbon (HCO3(-)) transporter
MGAVTNLRQNDMDNVIDPIATDSILVKRSNSRQKPLVGAYVALLLFMLVYCARPEDWIPGLSNVPLAKITGILALIALVFSLRDIRQRLPREVIYLALLVGQLFLASVLSPVWRGGALQSTLDFAKILILVIVMALAVNTGRRLRQLIFIHAASVALIAAVTVWKERVRVGRLEGMLGGNYSNPNDLALALVVSLPLCLALLFLSRGRVWKTAWALAMVVMTYAVFLTASRGGFLSLIVMVAVCLWEFAIRGRRRYLFVLAALVSVILWQSSSGMLAGRLKGTLDAKEDTSSAYGSAQERQELFWRSVEVTRNHPLIGVGPGNFEVLSGNWHGTHNSFTQMSSEAGVPALILYVLILWFGFKNVRATKRFGRGPKELVILAGGLHASLAGYVVGSVFASTAYQYFPYFLIAYSTSLIWMSKEFAFRSKQDESARQKTTEKETLANAVGSEMAWYSY